MSEVNRLLYPDKPEAITKPEQWAVLSQVTAFAIESGLAAHATNRYREKERGYRVSAEALLAKVGENSYDLEVVAKARDDLLMAGAYEEAARAELPFAITSTKEETTADDNRPITLGLVRIDPSTGFSLQYREPLWPTGHAGISSFDVAKVYPGGIVEFDRGADDWDLNDKILATLVNLEKAQRAVNLRFLSDDVY